MSAEKRLVPASLSTRMAAFLLDTVIVVVAIVIAMAWSAGTTDLAQFLSQATYGELTIVLGVPLALQLGVMSLTRSTPGMWLADLTIVQAEGDPLDWGNIIRRPMGLIMMPLSIALLGLVPVMNEHRRTIGDFISGTRIVEKPARGQKVAYDSWRVFTKVIKPIAPASLAIAIAVTLMRQSRPHANRELLLDAAVIAATSTMLIAVMTTALLIKASQVRIDTSGIYRSSLLGWKKKAVSWVEIEYARVVQRSVLSYFEVTKKNKSRFKIPMECRVAGLTAYEFSRRGIRIDP